MYIQRSQIKSFQLLKKTVNHFFEQPNLKYIKLHSYFINHTQISLIHVISNYSLCFKQKQQVSFEFFQGNILVLKNQRVKNKKLEIDLEKILSGIKCYLTSFSRYFPRNLGFFVKNYVSLKFTYVLTLFQSKQLNFKFSKVFLNLIIESFS